MRECILMGMCIFLTFIRINAAKDGDQKSLFMECIEKYNIDMDKLLHILLDQKLDDPVFDVAWTCSWRARGIIKNGKIDTSSMIDFFKKSFVSSFSNGQDIDATISKCVDEANQEADELKLINAFVNCTTPAIIEGTHAMEKK